MGKKINGNLGSSNLLNMFDYLCLLQDQKISNGGENINNNSKPVKIKKKKPIFDFDGHVTLESIFERREFFLGKSIARIEYELVILLREKNRIDLVLKQKLL